MLLTGQLVFVASSVLFASSGFSEGATSNFLIDISPHFDHQQAPQAAAASGFVARAIEQIELGCDPRGGADPGENPYADTVIGRITPEITFDVDERRAAIAATLAQDSNFAWSETAVLRASEVPGVRYLGWLIPAYAIAKAQRPGYLDTLSRLLPSLRQVAGTVHFSSADVDYLAAVVLNGRGETTQALGKIAAALAEEPQFYNAILFGMRLQIATIGKGGFSSYRSCAAAFDGLFDSLLTLVGLTRCPLQASQSEIYLRRFLVDPMHNPAFLASQVYLGLMSHKMDFSRKALDRFDTRVEIPCKKSVSDRLHQLIELSVPHIDAGK